MSFFEGLEELAKTLPTSIYLENEPSLIPSNLKFAKTKVRKANGEMIMVTQITGIKEDLNAFVRLNNLKPLNNFTIIKNIGF